MAKKKLRILHTADVHLANIDDKECKGLQAVVASAQETKADLVIIAGDLFDSNRVKDNVVNFAIDQLRNVSADVVILPGNHDCLAVDSVYHRDALWKTASNVKIFYSPQGQTMSFPDLDLSLWGKPLDSYEHDISPLQGVPHPERNGQWHVAVAHGQYIGNDFNSFHALKITDEQLLNSGQDYIALGHWPIFRCVCEEPKAYYADSPLPSQTVVIVDFTEDAGVRVTRHPIKVEK